MSESEPRDEDREERRRAEEETAWFASSVLRIGLVLIGLVLLLFALGQAVGMDLLGLVQDALSTEVGRWLVVAFFALLLIVVAMRGFGTRTG